MRDRITDQGQHNMAEKVFLSYINLTFVKFPDVLKLNHERNTLLIYCCQSLKY